MVRIGPRRVRAQAVVRNRLDYVKVRFAPWG